MGDYAEKVILTLLLVATLLIIIAATFGVLGLELYANAIGFAGVALLLVCGVAVIVSMLISVWTSE